MSSENYLLRLTIELTEGLARLPEEVRARHVGYLTRKQNADGGWAGREGESDLYYTAFALRGLVVLDALDPATCERACGFLRQSLSRQTTVVDFFSFLYACALTALHGQDVLRDSVPDWPDRVARMLETLRTDDGGYRKTTSSPAGSTYHTFLVGLCYQLLGQPLPDVEGAVRFILARRRDDGGFVEVAAQRRSGTNPTAAAVGLLQLAQEDVPALDDEIREGVADFLAEMPSPDGGLCANTRAPLADLLSTFTGTWTLRQINALDRVDVGEIRRYAGSLQLPDGGFRGGLWDDGDDVEYTFYGLGVLGIGG